MSTIIKFGLFLLIFVYNLKLIYLHHQYPKRSYTGILKEMHLFPEDECSILDVMKKSKVLDLNGDLNEDFVGNLAAADEIKFVERCSHINDCDKCKQAFDIYKCLMDQ